MNIIPNESPKQPGALFRIAQAGRFRWGNESQLYTSKIGVIPQQIIPYTKHEIITKIESPVKLTKVEQRIIFSDQKLATTSQFKAKYMYRNQL